MSSSCCGGNCGCGSSCKCGSGCGGCNKMYPDMSYSESSTAETLVVGLPSNKASYEGAAGGAAAENNGGCKCNPCSCNPCTCK